MAPMMAPPATVKDNTPSNFGEESGPSRRAHRIVIYGSGGIGKSSLATAAPNAKVIDLDDGTRDLDVRRVTLPPGIDTWSWSLLLKALNTPAVWKGVDTIVLDTATKAEELCSAWVCANIPHEKGNKIEGIEDYGWGKGFSYIYDEFLKLLLALDRHMAQGRNVVMIAHECVSEVPNPGGADWKRYEPRLQSPASGKNSTRLRIKEWADHLLFIGYDVVVKDEKAVGSGSRCIYPQERPTHMAKSRTIVKDIVYRKGEAQAFWDLFELPE